MSSCIRGTFQRMNLQLKGITNMKKLIIALYLSTFITACGGGKSSETSTPPPTNVPPLANAGVEQTVDENSEVTLSGLGTDTDGNISIYSWKQIAGLSVSLDNQNSAITTFTAPDINIDETLTFELTVTDDDGDSSTDSVNVKIMHVNNAPISVTGEYTAIIQFDTIELDGSQSSDLDGDELSYSWSVLTAPENSASTIINSSSALATFEPDINGTYTLALTVSDGILENQSEVEIIADRFIPSWVDKVEVYGVTIPREILIEHCIENDLLDCTYEYSLLTMTATAISSDSKLKLSTSIGYYKNENNWLEIDVPNEELYSTLWTSLWLVGDEKAENSKIHTVPIYFDNYTDENNKSRLVKRTSYAFGNPEDFYFNLYDKNEVHLTFHNTGNDKQSLFFSDKSSGLISMAKMHQEYLKLRANQEFEHYNAFAELSGISIEDVNKNCDFTLGISCNITNNTTPTISLYITNKEDSFHFGSISNNSGFELYKSGNGYESLNQRFEFFAKEKAKINGQLTYKNALGEVCFKTSITDIQYIENWNNDSSVVKNTGTLPVEFWSCISDSETISVIYDDGDNTFNLSISNKNSRFNKFYYISTNGYFTPTP